MYVTLNGKIQLYTNHYTLNKASDFKILHQKFVINTMSISAVDHCLNWPFWIH